jgi:phosphodiesterase/alkaline phosphatase D-like protein
MRLTAKTCISLLVLSLTLTVAVFGQKSEAPAEKIINGPVVEGVGDTWAVIAWTTNTGGSTILKYGTSQNRLDKTAQAPYADNDKVEHQTHRVHLKNLKPGTTYFFQAFSGQGEGTGTSDQSKIMQFTTKGLPGGLPQSGGEKAEALRIIDGPRVEGVGADSAVIAWTTNTGGSSVVRFGTDANNLSQTAQAPYADNESTKEQIHRVHLQHLKPGTTYFFIVDSGQGEGTGTEAKSKVAQFTTSK